MRSKAVFLLAAAATGLQLGDGAEDALAVNAARHSMPAFKLERLLLRGPVKLTDVNVEGVFNFPACGVLETDSVSFEGRVDGFGATCQHRRDDLARLQARDTTFQEEVDLYGGPVFDDFGCDRCVFKNFVYMHSFQAKYLNMLRSVFEDDVVLAAADLDYLNLADAAFRRSLDLSGASIGYFNTTRLRASQPILVGWAELGGDRWAEERIAWARYDDGTGQRQGQVGAEFRFWKRNFAELGDRRAELKANYYLIELNREFEFSPTDLDWWVAAIFKWPSEFGTKPYRPFIISALTIVGFAVLYLLGNGFRHKDDPERRLAWKERPFFALGFSLDTFVPVLKLSGVSEWGWVLGKGWMRWIGAAERTLGILLTAAAAYSVGSYVV